MAECSSYTTPYIRRSRPPAIASAGYFDQTGINPCWSRDGREIFYKQGESLISAPVSVAGGTLRPGTPVELFRNPVFTTDFQRPWDVHPDGKRFLLAEDDATEAKPTSIHVILNWPALLREKGPR